MNITELLKYAAGGVFVSMCFLGSYSFTSNWKSAPKIETPQQIAARLRLLEPAFELEPKRPMTHPGCLYKVTAAHAALSRREDMRHDLAYMRRMLTYCEGVIIERPDGQRIRWNEID